MLPLGDLVILDLDIDAGNYDTSRTYATSIGYMIEDWETGDFNRFPWVQGGNADWTIVTDNPYEGVYSARSGIITDDQISELEITTSVMEEGNISFYRKVSS